MPWGSTIAKSKCVAYCSTPGAARWQSMRIKGKTDKQIREELEMKNIERLRRQVKLGFGAWFMTCLIAGVAVGQDTIRYQEPDQLTDGAPVTDLESCTITWTDNVSGATASQTFTANPDGGVIRDYPVPGSIKAQIEDATTNVIGICQRTNGAVSASSNVLTVTFPVRSPNPPTLLP